MSSGIRWAIGAAVSAILVAGTATGEVRPEVPPEVTASMRAAFQSLVGLQPYLASPPRFRDPKNAQVIAEKLQAMAAVPHAFPARAGTGEPGLEALSGLFDGSLRSVQARFAGGEHEYARLQLRTITSLCFGCHSRVQASKDFEDLGHQVEALGLTPFEKAELLAATRQFDRAAAAYQAILAAPPRSEREHLQYTQALRHLLGILVRVKGDAAATTALLDGLARRGDLPKPITHLVESWRRDAAAWRKDRFDPRKASSAALVKKARALVEQAGGRAAFLSDSSRDILYLRASNALHEALARDGRLQQRGEALYLLGLCSAAVQDPTLWELDRLYFEACVRENPHSALARRCFARLSDRVYFGYTGSAGTNIPDDELEHLGALRAIAW